MRYISDIIKDEFKQWTNHKPILISAPTGSGKTTFILKNLLPYVKEQGKYLVYFVNRDYSPRKIPPIHGRIPLVRGSVPVRESAKNP